LSLPWLTELRVAPGKGKTRERGRQGEGEDKGKGKARGRHVFFTIRTNDTMVGNFSSKIRTNVFLISASSYTITDGRH